MTTWNLDLKSYKMRVCKGRFELCLLTKQILRVCDSVQIEKKVILCYLSSHQKELPHPTENTAPEPLSSVTYLHRNVTHLLHAWQTVNASHKEGAAASRSAILTDQMTCQTWQDTFGGKSLRQARKQSLSDKKWFFKKSAPEWFRKIFCFTLQLVNIIKYIPKLKWKTCKWVQSQLFKPSSDIMRLYLLQYHTCDTCCYGYIKQDNSWKPANPHSLNFLIFHN